MNSELPKQYLPLNGRKVIEHSLATLLSHPLVNAAVVVLSAGDEHWQNLGLQQRCKKPLYTAQGGAERALSVLNGLRELSRFAADDDWVLVHDAARPCLRREELDKLIDSLYNDPVGGLLAIRARDTVKRADSAGLVAETLPRGALWQAQTPQMFRYRSLLKALEQAARLTVDITDESAAIELLGLAPRLIEGRVDNIKITRQDDLGLAEHFLNRNT